MTTRTVPLDGIAEMAGHDHTNNWAPNIAAVLSS